ncbi:nicotinamide mononucleotide transporter family protein, partial [Klebsiella pneumoniae]|uniref:nicotinamide mononucleotide transporter family protein n=1 Tax=Klebsiella pneumoniae TaxID=573 RepID=UPI002730DA44
AGEDMQRRERLAVRNLFTDLREQHPPSKVWLTAQRVRWCWPVSVVAVLLYAWIFFDVKLYSDMLLQLVFAALQGYGWW